MTINLTALRQFTIGGFGSYSDWGCWIAADDNQWKLSEPVPKTYYVDIPEADGQLDLTESLTGNVAYQQRPLDIFLIFPPDTTANWEAKRQMIVNAIHGKYLKCSFPEDTEHYMQGRFTVGDFVPDYPLNTLEITALLDPWLYKNEVTTQSFTISGTQNITLPNARMRTTATISVSDTVSITQNGTTTEVTTASAVEQTFILVEGDNPMTITGNASVTFTYQEAIL